MRKSVAIIGEGETEWFYFESLRVAKRYPFKVAPGMPQHSDIGHMKKMVDESIRQQFDIVFCLVDMDRLLRTPKEMRSYRSIKAKYERMKSCYVKFIQTSPCTEFWFLLHFLPGNGNRTYQTYEELLPELKRFLPDYEKTKRYFSRRNLFTYLSENGDLERVITNAKKLSELAKQTPEDYRCYSEIYEVLQTLATLEQG